MFIFLHFFFIFIKVASIELNIIKAKKIFELQF